MTPPDENAWDAWSPNQLAEKLRGIGVHWYVVGGWALDLWHGAPRREHDDLEFAVSPKDASRIASHLSELTFFETRGGCFRHSTFDSPIDIDAWQFWGADMRKGHWRVDMMMERGSADLWRYKRDASLEQPRVSAIRSNAQGIPYLAPPNVLLFKAKYCRSKDDDDFEAALPKLGSDDRENLRRWLRSIYPDHKWLQQLT